MKKVFLYFTFALVFASTASKAQGTQAMSLSLNFQDSVRLALENTKNLDATVIGTGFSGAWSRLTLDQQQTIRRQTAFLKRKKFPLKWSIINYFGAIVNAVNIEQVDASTLSSFLTVTGKVIDNYPPNKAATFFEISRAFFQSHALHAEKSFRLYAKDLSYKFDYIAPPPSVDWSDTTQLQQSEQVDYQQNDSDSYSNSDTTQYVDPPLWMSPAPQPTLEGPVIKFDKLTLNFVTKYDSVFLSNTKGSLSLITNTFVGDGGKFDWAPAGLSPDSVYCNFTQYNFNATRPELKADVVKLNYTGKTPGSIPGTFEFKSQPRKDSVLSSYPRFKSYQSTLQINNLGDKNLQYRGGFSLTGNKISGQSVSGEDATIEVSAKGEKKFIARAPEFIFDKKSVYAEKAQVNLLQNSDSIVHQSVKLRYFFGADSTQRLFLQKVKGDMKNAPYTSTFFNVDFSADVIDWSLYGDSINMRTEGGRSIVPLIIESVDFYDPDDYRLLKGTGFSFHPLAVMVNYALKKKTREFYPDDVASYYKKDGGEIKKAVDFLKQKGMINYSAKTNKVFVKQKAIDLYRAYKGDEDYDNLKIHSIADTIANATINLTKGYMDVRGVDEFSISDSLNVRIKPDSSVITLLKDRDMKFNGRITAGNFEINGKGFQLKYDSFYITLTHIDSINFYITEMNSRGQKVRRKVNNSMVGADSTAASIGGLMNLRNASGTLYISKPNNKSGKVKVANFPRLDATTGGVIYFDREEILGGVYDRSMFFVVPPFKLDSLNDADPASINFEGTFASNGMFPNFKEKLHTQADKSLGFDHAIPKSGYQLYKGDGKMHGTLRMDHSGLRGVGAIDNYGVTLYSSDFIFYPDSVITKGRRGKSVEKQFENVLFPQASFGEYDMKWYPKEDKMRLKNIGAPFNFYDSTAQMQGTLNISKAGISGIGKVETRGTEIVSRDMKFFGNDFSARHTRFKVKSDDPNKHLMYGVDVRLKFNLKENYADISPEVEGVAAIDFPYAQFKTSIPNARWDLKKQKITMSKAPNVPLENSYFYTTRKDLDSLRFNAEKAEYDLKTQQLKVSGIPYIIVADAKITPENNEVLILENARIGTLKNTTIVLDTLNGYHRLTEGVVDIISRNEFSGYATYQYVNLLSDTFSIKMTDFHLEPLVKIEEGSKSRKVDVDSLSAMQTVAKGSVTDKESVVLGAGMFYKGDMTMYATKPALQLDGFVKLDIRKIKNYNTWIQYKQSGDETEVLIDFDNAVTEDGKKPTAGLHTSSADKSLYITFLNDKKNEDDENFFEPTGTLFYDKDTKEYKIEDTEKSKGNKLSGKVFAYNDENMQVRFEGPVNIFNGSGDFNITSSVLGSGNMETNEIRMNSLLVVDSNVPSSAFDIMARNLQDVIVNEGAAEGLGDQTELLYKIADIAGERLTRDYEQKSQQGYVSLGTLSPLAKPLVFSDVNLKWHPKLKAFYNEGNLGISNIFRNDINGGFEGFMEIKKNEDGISVFHVFIKASPESWYYFGFEDNRLLVYSSNEDFNRVISKRSNAGKVKVGEIAFIPGSEDETLAFINRFRKDYYGINVPYSLSDAANIVDKRAEDVVVPTKDTKKKKEEDVEDVERNTNDQKKDQPTEQPKDDKKKKEEDDGF